MTEFNEWTPTPTDVLTEMTVDAYLLYLARLDAGESYADAYAHAVTQFPTPAQA